MTANQQAVFTPQMVANRQNSRVYTALDAVLPRIGSLEDTKRVGGREIGLVPASVFFIL